jgi:hypothetical protein
MKGPAMPSRRLREIAKKPATRGQAKLKKAQEKAYRELKALLANRRHQQLDWYLAVGQKTQVLAPAAPTKQQRSGGAISALSDKLNRDGVPCHPDLLFRSRTLVTGFSKKEIAELKRKRKDRRGQPKLGLTQIFRLAILPSEDREALMQSCLDDLWSAQKLDTKVQNRRGYYLKDGRGPSPEPEPRPLLLALRDFRILSRRWLLHARACQKSIKKQPKRKSTAPKLAARLQKEVGFAQAELRLIHKAVAQLQQALRQCEDAVG